MSTISSLFILWEVDPGIDIEILKFQFKFEIPKFLIFFFIENFFIFLAGKFGDLTPGGSA